MPTFCCTRNSGKSTALSVLSDRATFVFSSDNPPVTSFFTALRRQGNVFLALLNREEERRRKSPVEALIGVLEPLLVIAVLSGIWYLFGSRARAPVGNSPVLFYATGLLPLYLFISIANRGTKDWASSSRRFPIEQRLDLYIVAILLRVSDYIIVGVLFFGGLYAYGISDASPNDYGAIFEALTAIAMLGFGWGALQVTLRQVFPFYAYLNVAITRSLVFFSGIFFVPDTLPPNIRYPLSFNPMLQAIELFKHGFYPNYAPLTLDRPYLAGWAIVFVLMGLVIERITRRSEGPSRRIVRK